MRIIKYQTKHLESMKSKKFKFINDDMNDKKPTLEELKNWIETNQL